MNTRTTNTIYTSFLKRFFQNSNNILGCSFTLIILIISYFTFFKKDPLQFFPNNKNIEVDFYNDSIDNGKSVITSSWQTDTSVGMNYILRDGFIRPYVGIGFEDKKQAEFDISKYNRVKVDISGENIKSVFVYLILKDTTAIFEGKPLGFRHLCKYIEVSPKRKTFRLSKGNFSTPDWWYDKYNLSPSTTKAPDWSRMYRVALATGLTPAQNVEQSITIYSIIFYRDNTRVILLMAFIQLMVISGLMWVYYLKTKPKKKQNFVTINYHAVSLEPNQTAKVDFLDYINENFHNADLSLKLIAKEVGISQRKIAESISSRFNCNVKTYINQIRINEAQRLLKESNLHISEIAYKVGFSSPSNFNRVFKNLTGQSPSEFLQANS